jgi:hypothetical protein
MIDDTTKKPTHQLDIRRRAGNVTMTNPTGGPIVTKPLTAADIAARYVSSVPTTTKPPAPKPQGSSQVEAFLRRSQAMRVATTEAQGRLIFALDATASRQPTWDAACELQVQMFNEVCGLNVQLVYFRGHKECRASGWYSSGDRLGGLMRNIQCMSGATQIGRIIDHVIGQTNKAKVAAAVFVGDCMEEDLDELASKARELGSLGLPMFMFQEGRDTTAEAAYRKIATLTHGAYCHFDTGAAHQLAELLRAVAAYATGGVKALEAKSGNSATTRLLIEQLKR